MIDSVAGISSALAPHNVVTMSGTGARVADLSR